MADGQVAGEAGQGALVEHGGDETHVLHHGDGLAVAHRHAGRFLAPVLQGVEAVEGELGHRLTGGVDAEDATGFFHVGPHRIALMDATQSDRAAGALGARSVEPTGPRRLRRPTAPAGPAARQRTGHGAVTRRPRPVASPGDRPAHPLDRLRRDRSRRAGSPSWPPRPAARPSPSPTTTAWTAWPRPAARPPRSGVALVPGCEVSCRKPPPCGQPTDRAVHARPRLLRRAGRGPAPGRAGPPARRPGRAQPALAEPAGRARVPVDYDAHGGRGRGRGRAWAAPTSPGPWCEAGAAEDIDDAFDRWLADGRPAYVPKSRLYPVATWPAWPRASGGVAVLAHPLSLGLDPLGPRARWWASWPRPASAGIEAYLRPLHPRRAPGARRLAGAHGLVATGGSDYHGTLQARPRGGDGHAATWTSPTRPRATWPPACCR